MLDNGCKPPSWRHSLLTFGTILLFISLGLFRFDINLHVILFFALLWSALNSTLLGYSFAAIRQMMSDSITRALPAIYIFILIGMVIASFMHSGTIASLIYYGLNLLSPTWFLVAGLVLCSLMSVATGTSWGTVGTLGVVLIGIGGSMGIPLPLVAGMIVSGATFGDKLSPISDTTNLAAMSAGTDLYKHIGSMLYTTVPSFLLVSCIFIVFGFQYSGQSLNKDELEAIQRALDNSYNINLHFNLLPLLVLLVLSIKRVSAEVSMAASIVTAVLIALLLQGTEAPVVLNALWSNIPGDTGIETLDSLLGRGGIASMSWTLLLALIAIAMGGVLHGSGFLRVLLSAITSRLVRSTSLVATTIGSGIIGNMAMGEAYISIILNCELFKDNYKKNKLDNAVLSRSVEEGATLSTGLIPWTTAGAFYTATLGVPVLAYAPYAFFNFLNPLVAIAMAAMGFGLLVRSDDSETGSGLDDVDLMDSDSI